MSNKGHEGMFHHPDYIRKQITHNFKDIVNENQFWEFFENDIGKYVFSTENLTLPDGSTDYSKLKEYDV